MARRETGSRSGALDRPAPARGDPGALVNPTSAGSPAALDKLTAQAGGPAIVPKHDTDQGSEQAELDAKVLALIPEYPNTISTSALVKIMFGEDEADEGAACQEDEGAAWRKDKKG